METNDAQRLVKQLSDPAILAAELDLAQRRVAALIGELSSHLDHENDLEEEAIRRRAAYIRSLEEFEHQRESERWVNRLTYTLSLTLGLSGWIAFCGLLWYVTAFGCH
ncbi:MAG: hypothetical protein ACREA9_21105 [Pyrinomonadaceae bacterium]